MPGSPGERLLVALFAGVALVTAVIVLLNLVSGGNEAAAQPSPSPGMATASAATTTSPSPTPGESEAPPSLPASLAPIPSVAPLPTPLPGTDAWLLDAQHHRGQVDEQFVYACPGPAPAGTAIDPAYVFGTGTYSDDSIVCLAAVHAGIITLGGGGEVTIVILPGQYTYNGSLQNGVTTRDWLEAWWGSFAFVDS